MLSFRTLPADASPAGELLAAMVAEMNAIYEGTIDGHDTPTATPADLGPPAGRSWSGSSTARRSAPGA